MKWDQNTQCILFITKIKICNSATHNNTVLNYDNRVIHGEQNAPQIRHEHCVTILLMPLKYKLSCD